MCVEIIQYIMYVFIAPAALELRMKTFLSDIAELV